MWWHIMKESEGHWQKIKVQAFACCFSLYRIKLNEFDSFLVSLTNETIENREIIFKANFYFIFFCHQLYEYWDNSNHCFFITCHFNSKQNKSIKIDLVSLICSFSVPYHQQVMTSISYLSFFINCFIFFFFHTLCFFGYTQKRRLKYS